MNYNKYLQVDESMHQSDGLTNLMKDKKMEDAIMADIIRLWDKDYTGRTGGIDGVSMDTMKKDIEKIVNKHGRGWDRKRKEMMVYNYYTSLTGNYYK